jgi:UDP-N-acetylmuramoyl-tripeptide--D-alanyl-D-alanine ligase
VAAQKRTLQIGDLDVEFTGISIDSRTTQPGNLFIGLKGKHLNGNQFALDALTKGASAAVIDDPAFVCNSEALSPLSHPSEPELRAGDTSGRSTAYLTAREYSSTGSKHQKASSEDLLYKAILVEDSLEILKGIGLRIKDLVNPKTIIGITGSVGKTTTKLWLNRVLNEYSLTFASDNNYNTIYGVPICFSMLSDGTEYCILEFGSSSKGEISTLSKYAGPNIGIITNVFESHIGNFDDKFELAVEKISIIDGMPEGGTLIYHGDSEFAGAIKAAALARNLIPISVGYSKGSDVYIKSGPPIELHAAKKTFRYEIGCHGIHYEYISACVVGVLIALDLDPSSALPLFRELKPLQGRGEVIDCTCRGKHLTIIDGSYNASPTSMLASIDVLSSYEGAKIAIIGQMKGLGSHEAEYHYTIVQELSNHRDIRQVYFVGERKLWGIFVHHHPAIKCFASLDEAAILEIIDLLPNDVTILLKGSNSIGLSKFIEYIRSHIHTPAIQQPSTWLPNSMSKKKLAEGGL